MSYFVQRGSAAAGLLVLAGFADLWLVRRPEPHSVSEFSPFSARLVKEEMVLTNSASKDGPLLTHQGGKNEVVELFFDRAALEGEAAPQRMAYMTDEDSPDAHGSPCRTTVNVSLENSAAAELRLFQRGLPGGVHQRDIEIKPLGSRLLVEFQTMGDDATRTNQPGCKKILQIGESRRTVMQHQVKVLSEAGSIVRLKFMPASGPPNWDGANGLFEPFQAISLKAQSVRVSPVSSPEILSSVQTTDNKASIDIDNLLIGTDTLQCAISGVGLVKKDGRLVPPSFDEWISASYARSAAVAFANLLVLVGAVAFVIRGRRLKLPVGTSKGEIFPSKDSGLRVFLCHCSEDKPTVRDLCKRMQSDAFQPWLDERDILPARHWDEEIQEALAQSDAVVICLSKIFVRKEGFVQRELRYALVRAEEKPDDAIFLIPVRLEMCEIPSKLRGLQCIDLFAGDGYEKLAQALKERTRQLGTAEKAEA